MTIPDMKPCPFCGTAISDFTLTFRDGHLDEMEAQCGLCNIRFILLDDYNDFPPNAIDRWNRRKT